MRPFITILLAMFLYGCGLKEDMQATKDKHHDEDYQRGYDWAKSNGITSDKQCVRFMTLAMESSSLQGCIDYFHEYEKKARAFFGEDNESGEIEAAPSAPVEDVQIEQDCESIDQFCTN